MKEGHEGAVERSGVSVTMTTSTRAYIVSDAQVNCLRGEHEAEVGWQISPDGPDIQLCAHCRAVFVAR